MGTSRGQSILVKAVRTVTLSLLRSEKCRRLPLIPLTERPQDSQTERISKYSPLRSPHPPALEGTGGDGPCCLEKKPVSFTN